MTSKTKKKYIDIYSVKYLCRKNNFISKVLCHTRKVYLCIKGTDFASFYDFRNVTDSVIFFVLVLLCHLFSLFFFFILFEPLDIVTPNKKFHKLFFRWISSAKYSLSNAHNFFNNIINVVCGV